LSGTENQSIVSEPQKILSVAYSTNKDFTVPPSKTGDFPSEDVYYQNA
jgi:hypothetical protein